MDWNWSRQLKKQSDKPLFFKVRLTISKTQIRHEQNKLNDTVQAISKFISFLTSIIST